MQNALIAQATGGSADDQEFQRLRKIVIENTGLQDIAPKFLRTCRNLSQFWQFIKYELPTYAERCQYIWDAFRPLLERIESGRLTPADEAVSVTLKAFNAESVNQLWTKAMERRDNDPEGAITLARTLLESVCKHILDERNAQYKPDSDLPSLYKATSKELNIAPSQHSEDVFKQIAPRHAELAVTLSGAVAQFLVATNEHNKPS